MLRTALSHCRERYSLKLSTLKTALAVSVTRQMTAMPISMGLPRQSLIFWRELERVMSLREIFLLVISAAASAFLPRAAFSSAFPAELPPSTSPDWLSLVLAAGLTAVQKGLTK